MADESTKTLSEAEYLHAEGKSTAAWTGVWISLIGFAISAIALPFGQIVVFALGLVVAVAGGIIGKVMTDMGYGVGGTKNRN